MGRKVKRVPHDFCWPLNEVWFGYILESVTCKLCGGTGDHLSDNWPESLCQLCEGEGTVYPKIEAPIGEAYQMWETTSEGSPISPPCDTKEELAEWLTANNASAYGTLTGTYEQWLQMIEDGECCSMLINVSPTTTAIYSGVEACSVKQDENKPLA